MNINQNTCAKVALALALCLQVKGSTPTTTATTATAPVEQKHLLQYYGPEANSKAFISDLALYSKSWPFYEGRIAEFNGKFAFTKTSMTDTQFSADISKIKGFSSPTLGRNYVRLLASAQFTSGNPSATWNLWSDADRDAVVNNFRALARQAKSTGFKGIFFDTEPYTLYGYNPWQYSDHKAPGWSQTSAGTWVNAHTFADTKARMQDLGARVMAALESESPGTRILFSQGLSAMNDLCSGSSVDPVKWSNHKYGLLAPFIAGLSSKVNKCRIVDMQESVGYWATREADFQAGSSFLYNLGASLLLPADIVPQYRSTIQWGFMLYTDGLYRLTSSKGYLSGWMLASERPVFAATMTYWALKNASSCGGADEDVIVYTENSMWGTNWAGTAVAYPPSSNIPNSFATGLGNYRNGRAPADVSQIVANAWARKRNNQWPSN